VVCCLVCPVSAADKAEPRDYAAGPLTKDDFQGKVPPSPVTADGTPLRAYLSGGIDYRYKYRYTVKDGDFDLSATEVTVYAAVEREKSWNSDPDSAGLLDHEQGHFDLAAIYAAKLRAELRKMMTRKELTFKAKSEAEGKKALEDRLKKALDNTLAELRVEDRRYDSETKHGTEPTEQAKHRAHHRRLLREWKVGATEKKRKP
jgi:hypothetical protein